MHTKAAPTAKKVAERRTFTLENPARRARRIDDFTEAHLPVGTATDLNPTQHPLTPIGDHAPGAPIENGQALQGIASSRHGYSWTKIRAANLQELYIYTASLRAQAS
jgi:hypothetical protein